MTIEVLFPEYCNLFGDMANMRYLRKCIPEAEFVETGIFDTPYFSVKKPDMIYMGPMTEKTQQKVIDKLLPLKDRLHELIGAGTIFLMTGNALEVFGKYIETDDGEKIQGLGLLDLYAKRDMLHRHNSECEAEFNGMTILGFKTQFTQCFPKDESHGLFTVVKGMGMNMKSKKEGIRVNNFMGTYLVGPLLIMNPEFTEYIVKLLGFKDRKPYLYNEVTEAFKERKEDFDRNIPKKVKKYRYM